MFSAHEKLKVRNQKVNLDIDFAQKQLSGNTQLEILQKKIDQVITLHARQVHVKSVSVNGVAARYHLVHNTPLDKICPSAHDNHRETRDLLNFTISYRRAYEKADKGELYIEIPASDPSGNPLVPKEPGENETGANDTSIGIWKVDIKFSIKNPRGGVIFAGGLPGDVPSHCYTDGQIDSARMWFPCWDRLDVSYPLEVRVSVPDGNIVLCSLPEVETRVKKGKVRSTFMSQEGFNLPVRSLAMAAGPFIRLPDPGMSQRIVHYCLPHVNAEQVTLHSTPCDLL
eukprot:541644-Hanusia_phi.AAC.3